MTNCMHVAIPEPYFPHCASHIRDTYSKQKKPPCNSSIFFYEYCCLQECDGTWNW